MEDVQTDICRVCRSEGTSDKPLYHPCVCTGSIKFIHQECLVQWLKYSRKEYCELCKHRFAFTPIYSPDMPKRLPIKDILNGLLKSIGRAVRYWFHYTLVAIAWLGIVPLTACRIYRCLFTGSVNSLLTLPLDMLSTENLLTDCFQGCFVVSCTLCAFISLVWLREQILHGGGPEWLDPGEHVHHLHNVNQNVQNGFENGPVGQGGAGVGEDPGAGLEQPPAGVANGVVEDEDEMDENGQLGNGNNLAPEENWNPIEWDRAAEELTWERLLGLDGSLVFLEHVFWVVSLNTLFILVFAFCPFHIGHFIIIGLKTEKWLMATQFDGLLTTLLGYLVIALSLVLLHSVASLARFRRSRRVLGLCYVVVKVSLLVIVEIGIFPLICGWWLDICSLAMFDATIKDRLKSFAQAPVTSMFIHWLVGMVYVFYFASFILLLREVLRPGVLWFLRNLNDPDFNPIQEMIHLPIYRHVRRFVASMIIFGSTVLVMLWIPIRLIRHLMPTFLPYNVVLSSDAPVSELSLELLLLQVVLPALLEQGHTRQWLKNVVRAWCIGVSCLLNLRSYLLGDIPLVDNEERAEQVLEPEAAQHEEAAQPDDAAQPEEDRAMPGQEAPLPYGAMPEHEAEREDGAGHYHNVGLPQDEDTLADQEAVQQDEAMDDLAAQLDRALQQAEGVLVDDVMEPIEAEPPEEDAEAGQGVPANPPVGQVGVGLQAGLGAAHQALLQGGGPTGFQPYKQPNVFHLRLGYLLLLMCLTLFLTSFISLIVPVYIGRRLMSVWMGQMKIHELYTAGCGLYTCWLTLRACTVLYHWLPQGWHVIIDKLTDWGILGLKSIFLASQLIGLVPLLLGLLFELVVVAPLRVPLDQTPIFFPWQDWAFGVLQAKIICAVTLMGPQWWLKRVIEQVYNQGMRNMDVWFIFESLCAPVITCLALSLAVPYVIARSFVPLLALGFETENLVLRHIYPFLLAIFVLGAFCIFQARQFRRLYEHIKNDKYLVGQRLVNYERRARLAAQAAAASFSHAAQ